MTWTGRPRPTVLDYWVAVALTFSSQVEIWAPQMVPGVGQVTGSIPLLTVTAMAMTLPLALRRVTPLAVLVTVLASAAVQGWLTQPVEGLSSLAAMMIAAYSSSAFTDLSKAVVGAVTLVVGIALVGLASGDVAFMATVLGSAWLTGFIVNQRSGKLVQLAGDNRDLSQRLSEATAQLAEAERRRVSGSAAPGPGDLAALTARELEVTRAVATGMTNAEIARELFISEWTVKTHVAAILRKLGLRDRTQVVVVAYESGLVQPHLPADQ